MIYNASTPILKNDSFVVARDMIEIIYALSNQILDSKYSKTSTGAYQ